MTHLLYNTKENNSPRNLATICPKIYISCIPGLELRETRIGMVKNGLRVAEISYDAFSWSISYCQLRNCCDMLHGQHLYSIICSHHKF